MSKPEKSDWTAESLKIVKMEDFQKAPLSAMQSINDFLQIEAKYSG